MRTITHSPLFSESNHKFVGQLLYCFRLGEPRLGQQGEEGKRLGEGRGRDKNPSPFLRAEPSERGAESRPC